MVLRPPAASAVVHRHYQVRRTQEGGGGVSKNTSTFVSWTCLVIDIFNSRLFDIAELALNPNYIFVSHSYYFWKQRGAIATLELRGALFFGSSLKILDEVKTVLNGSPSTSTSLSSSNGSFGSSSSSSNGSSSSSSSSSTSTSSNGPMSYLLNGPLNLFAPRTRENDATLKNTTAAGQDTRTANSGYFRVPPSDGEDGSSFDSSPPPPPPPATAAAPRTPLSQSPRNFGEGAPGTWNSCVMVRLKKI